MNEPKSIEDEVKAIGGGYPSGIDGLQSSFLDNPQNNNRYGQQTNYHNDEGKIGIHDTIYFSEFVEALSKLSLITMQNVTAFTELKKIRVGLNFLIEYYVTVSVLGYFTCPVLHLQYLSVFLTFYQWSNPHPLISRILM